MDPFKGLKEYFAFTKNEQKVFLFLSVVFLAGAAVKVYKAYAVPSTTFDYAASDSVFTTRSHSLVSSNAAADSSRSGKIDLNTATKADLMELPGIGEAMADRILLYREEKGPIKKIDELRKVKGIGEKKFEKLKPHIEVK
ncbi:MAG: ComEA family DNA-binding protein [Bacteroidota bacterium]